MSSEQPDRDHGAEVNVVVNRADKDARWKAYDLEQRMIAAFPGVMFVFSLMDETDVDENAMYRAHRRAARADARLRAQRKRHAQREAKLKAQLDEAHARLDRAMEIVQYVALGDHIRDWGADARVTILERINKQAQTLVAQEKVRKQT